MLRCWVSGFHCVEGKYFLQLQSQALKEKLPWKVEALHTCERTETTCPTTQKTWVISSTSVSPLSPRFLQNVRPHGVTVQMAVTWTLARVRTCHTCIYECYWQRCVTVHFNNLNITRMSTGGGWKLPIHYPHASKLTCLILWLFTITWLHISNLHASAPNPTMKCNTGAENSIQYSLSKCAIRLKVPVCMTSTNLTNLYVSSTFQAVFSVFEKSQKVTIMFNMSVCLSVSMYKPFSPWIDFCENFILRSFIKMC